jgi:hypothetical protein
LGVGRDGGCGQPGENRGEGIPGISLSTSLFSCLSTLLSIASNHSPARAREEDQKWKGMLGGAGAGGEGRRVRATGERRHGEDLVHQRRPLALAARCGGATLDGVEAAVDARPRHVHGAEAARARVCVCVCVRAHACV